MSRDVARDFIREIVAADVAAGKHGGIVRTRFPPEPNGYLHIGHATAICLDFGIAEEFGGTCNLRMDDTNPATEDPIYVQAIARDVAWLGFRWEGEIRYASDYFPMFYELALQLVKDGKAYVDSLSEEEIRTYRGTVTEPGKPSPHRDRSVEENLELLTRMRAGEFPDGAHVLRAKIDLASPNMKMRDPLLYRIRHARHYRTGNEWPIYPMYDWAHPLSDAIEGITHSLCTLEFEVNRPLYDWVVENTRPAAIGLADSEEPGAWDPRPRQYEFARRNLTYTVMSKRKLLRLVQEGHVDGWDDPRMPTLAGLRRRGVPPAAIRTFCRLEGISKADHRAEITKLEFAIRDELNRTAPRVMAVLDPLRVVVTNYPEGEVEWLDAACFPPDVDPPPSDWPATRKLPFSRLLYIERADFHPRPPEGYRRLSPGREVRLRHGYFLRCEEAVRNEEGEVVELRCTYDPETRGGSAPDGRRPAGTIHWVSAEHALRCEVRLYDRLFAEPDPEARGEEFVKALNPNSLRVLENARVEPSVGDDDPETRYQFERQGYFVRDRPESEPGRPESEPGRAESEAGRPEAASDAGEAGSEGTETGSDAANTGSDAAARAPAGRLVFNRTVALRDTWRAPPPDRAPVREEAIARGGRTTRDEPYRGEAPASGKARAGERSRRSAERERARAEDPELAERFRRWQEELGLSEADADILTGSRDLARLFEEALRVRDGENPRPVANWVIHELRGAIGDRAVAELPFSGTEVGELVELVESGTISGATGQLVLQRMLTEGGSPREIVEREGLERIDDEEQLASVVRRVVTDHPEEVRRYREGQEGLLGFFVGRVMRETEGRADARLAEELIRSVLNG